MLVPDSCADCHPSVSFVCRLCPQVRKIIQMGMVSTGYVRGSRSADVDARYSDYDGDEAVGQGAVVRST